MRMLLMLFVLLLGSAFAHEPAGDHTRPPGAPAPVEQTAAGAVYGAALPDPMPTATTIDAAAANIAAHAGTTAAFSGRITEVCQKQGCWLVLTGKDDTFARVAMHDHAFSVPKDANGPAVVYGTLTEKVLSAEEIEHLKKDGAQAPAARELSIDALSVLIPGAH